MELYKDVKDYQKHIEKVFDAVNWLGKEVLLMKTDSDMFKGWNKTDSTIYEVGNVFRRSVNGISVKFITILEANEQYSEPWDAPQCFKPIQYSTDYNLKPIPCNWVENEHLIRNCHRVCPIDGKTYWYKYDNGVSSIPPSEARALNPKEWGEV